MAWEVVGQFDLPDGGSVEELPPGGTAGQVLALDDQGQPVWVTPVDPTSGLPGGGTAGQVLALDEEGQPMWLNPSGGSSAPALGGGIDRTSDYPENPPVGTGYWNFDLVENTWTFYRLVHAALYPDTDVTAPWAAAGTSFQLPDELPWEEISEVPNLGQVQTDDTPPWSHSVHFITAELNADTVVQVPISLGLDLADLGSNAIAVGATYLPPGIDQWETAKWVDVPCILAFLHFADATVLGIPGPIYYPVVVRKGFPVQAEVGSATQVVGDPISVEDVNTALDVYRDMFAPYEIEFLDDVPLYMGVPFTLDTLGLTVALPKYIVAPLPTNVTWRAVGAPIYVAPTVPDPAASGFEPGPSGGVYLDGLTTAPDDNGSVRYRSPEDESPAWSSPLGGQLRLAPGLYRIDIITGVNWTGETTGDYKLDIQGSTDGTPAGRAIVTGTLTGEESGNDTIAQADVYVTNYAPFQPLFVSLSPDSTLTGSMDLTIRISPIFLIQ